MMKKINVNILILFFSLLLFPFCSKDDNGISSELLKANFEVSLNQSTTPAIATFINKSKVADSYSWNFGETAGSPMNTSTEENPSHTYNNSGVYTVKLTATNTSTNTSDEFTLNVTITKPITFKRVYDKNTYERFNAAIYVNSGGFAAVGSTENSNGVKGWFVKTDANGDIQFSRTYENNDDDIIFSSITALQSGGFAMTGYSEGRGILVTTDVNGNVISKRIFEIGNYLELYSIVELSSGGFAMAGLIENNINTEFAGFLLITDVNGNVITEKIYGSSSEESYLLSVIELSSGNLAMIGAREDAEELAWLLITDSNGNIISEKTYDSGEQLSSIIEVSSGSLAMVGSFYEDSESKSLFLTTNLNGDIINEKIYNNQKRLWSVTEMSSGNFAMVGRIDDESLLLITDSNGNIIHEKTYNSEAGSFLNSVIQLPTKGLAMAGYSYADSPFNSNGLLIVTDEKGDL